MAADVGFIEALNSINSQEKKNLIRDSDSPVAAEKQYPPFPVSRSLSYHADSILLVNELNIRGLASFKISNLMHYEFLLYCITPKKRFSKWSKVVKNETVEHIMELQCTSYEKALDIYNLLSIGDRNHIDNMFKSKEQNKK